MTASLPRFALKAAIVLAGVCALGIVPVERLASSQGVVAWGVAFAIVWVGAVLGYLPVTTRFAARSLETRAQAWMVGLGLRLFLVLGACVAVWSGRFVRPEPFLVGAGVGYAVVLVLEITAFLRLSRVETNVLTPKGT
jgi:hypothetical protein